MAGGLTIRKLVTSWGFEVDDRQLRKIERSIANAKTMAKVTLSLATAAFGAVFGLAKSSANTGDEVIKMSQKVSVGAETIQEMMYAAELANVQVDTLKNSLVILNDNAVKASKGGAEASAAFESIGVSAIDSNGKLKSNKQLMMEIADAFHGMSDEQRKAAPSLVRGVFGRSGAEMLPLLYGGAKGFKAMAIEARNAGRVMSEDTARAGQEMNDNLTRLKLTVGGLKNIIGAEFIPVVNEAVTSFTKWVGENKEFIRHSIGGALMFIVKNLKLIVSLTAALVAMKGGLAFVEMAKGAMEFAQALKKVAVMKAFAQGGLPFLLAAGVLGAGYAVGRATGLIGNGDSMGGAGDVPKAGSGSAMPPAIQVIDNRKITVTAPAGSDPSAIGQAVASASEPGMDRMLRRSARDFALTVQ